MLLLHLVSDDDDVDGSTVALPRHPRVPRPVQTRQSPGTPVPTLVSIGLPTSSLRSFRTMRTTRSSHVEWKGRLVAHTVVAWHVPTVPCRRNEIPIHARRDEWHVPIERPNDAIV